MWTNVSFVAFLEVTQPSRSLVVIRTVLIMTVALNVHVDTDFCWCTTRNAAKVWFSVCSFLPLFLVLFPAIQWETEGSKRKQRAWFVRNQASGFLSKLWCCVGGRVKQNFGFRAVFKWLSKNQNQSNYSDQSQQEQAAPWTNHNS